MLKKLKTICFSRDYTANYVFAATLVGRQQMWFLSLFTLCACINMVPSLKYEALSTSCICVDPMTSWLNQNLQKWLSNILILSHIMTCRMGFLTFDILFFRTHLLLWGSTRKHVRTSWDDLQPTVIWGDHFGVLSHSCM